VSSYWQNEKQQVLYKDISQPPVPTANQSTCLSLLNQHRCLSSETIQQPKDPTNHSTQDATDNRVECRKMSEKSERKLLQVVNY
jgi:hypothetical protein